MGKGGILGAFVLAMGVTLQCDAALLLNEPFDYVASSGPLSTRPGSPWTVVGTDNFVVHSGSLSKTGFPTSTGNKVGFGLGNGNVTATFTSQTSGTVFYSMLLSIDQMVGISAPAYIAALHQSSTTYGAPLWVRPNGTKFDLGISHRANSVEDQILYTTAPAKDVLTTFLVVVGYTFNGLAKDDVVRLWVDPSSSSFGGAAPAATLTYTNSSSFLNDLTGIVDIQLHQVSDPATPSLKLDELRVGTSWADVTSVPEPAMILPFAVAGLLLNRRRIRG